MVSHWNRCRAFYEASGIVFEIAQYVKNRMVSHWNRCRAFYEASDIVFEIAQYVEQDGVTLEQVQGPLRSKWYCI